MYLYILLRLNIFLNYISYICVNIINTCKRSRNLNIGIHLIITYKTYHNCKINLRVGINIIIYLYVSCVDTYRRVDMIIVFIIGTYI